MEQEQVVHVHIANGIGHIQMNRPKQLNSLSPNLVTGLIEALREMENQPEVKVILLSGEGKGFCGGGDLETMKTFTRPDEIANYMQSTSQLTKVLLELNKYVVSAVHGFAAGAGYSLALASDFIVADRAAKFALSFVNVGLIPDLGLIKLLCERVPRVVVKEWIATGKVITAEEALSHGIINRLAEGDLLANAREFAQLIVNGPAISNKFVKHLVKHAASLDWDTALMHENMIQTFLLQTEDHQEGVKAFYEKRRPQFAGR